MKIIINLRIPHYIKLLAIIFMVSCGNPYEGKILTSKNEKLKYSYGSWKIPKGSNSYTLKNTSVDKVKTYNIKVVRERYTLRPKTRAVKNSPERSEYFKKETLFPGEEKHLTHSIFFIGENEHDGDIDELISIQIVGAIVEDSSNTTN